MNLLDNEWKKFVLPKVFSDIHHDVLKRCDFCRLKYTPEELHTTLDKKSICRFCVTERKLTNV